MVHFEHPTELWTLQKREIVQSQWVADEDDEIWLLQILQILQIGLEFLFLRITLEHQVVNVVDVTDQLHKLQVKFKLTEPLVDPPKLSIAYCSLCHRLNNSNFKWHTHSPTL